ncbi:MAG: glycosyltransferase family 2 protein [Limnothrix sp. RL_2_0]|nr:glycosyltransferase family 2 protein [Limnothrix sp. RL_2_0]
MTEKESIKYSEVTTFCLTPIKNESWILDRFLKCASLWADHIIIADQDSADSSKDITKRYPKVRLLENPSAIFNEPERQSLLINAARRIPAQGKKLLIALDADEMLTANFLHSPEWNSILNADKGTLIKFQWVNLRSDLTSCWIPKEDHILGFMDDGSDHQGKTIHSHRVPVPENAPSLICKDIKVLHYQYTDWQRMQSKHRWYQCWERLNKPNQKSIKIYRQYHHMYAIRNKDIIPIKKEWIREYYNHKIDMTTVHQLSSYWWDKEVRIWFETYGVKKFKKENIWASNQLKSKEESKYSDPRTVIDKIVHQWLKITQRAFVGKLSLFIKLVDKIISLIY